MTDRINQDEIHAILWKAYDTFRGTVSLRADPCVCPISFRFPKPAFQSPQPNIPIH
jgi:hypothetical protein